MSSIWRQIELVWVAVTKRARTRLRPRTGFGEDAVPLQRATTSFPALGGISFSGSRRDPPNIVRGGRTEREDGYSPAELFYKRQVRGLLPELPKKLNVEDAEKARDKVQETYTAQRQTRSTSKPLGMGQRVWLQDQQTKRWTIDGVIKSIRDGGRSFVVETSGGAYLRNRRYIKAASSRIKLEMAGAIRRTNMAACNVDGETTTKKVHKKVNFKKAVHFFI